MNDDRQQLLALIQRDAIQRGDFVLSSGRRASFYIDLRLVTLSAAGSYLVGKAMLDLLADEPVDAVAGMTIAADPIVTAMALVSHLEGRPMAGLIVRKEAKQHGRGRQVEGPLQSGMRVVVVDDTFTTGGSALQAAAAVEEAGGQVGRVLGIVDRGEGARAAIEARGYRFDCLFQVGDLGVQS
jgi:orotate phosphoribosyltransferase